MIDGPLGEAELVEISVVDPAQRDAQFCVGEYFAELGRRFDTGYDPGLSLPAALDDFRLPAGVFLVATLYGEPVGCGGAKFHRDGTAELKRIWVSGSARGLGLGRRILTELESHAAAHGSRAVRLDTNKSLTEAIRLYRSAGYREVEAFNDEPYADHWFEKALGGLGETQLCRRDAL